MFNQTVRGMYCLRCASRKVVRGHLGESARFYPLRSVLRSLLGKPVYLAEQHSHACMVCGLTWNEVNPDELRKNLRDYGLSPHSTSVMQAIQPEARRATDVSVDLKL
jgi:hypothetical protein